MSCGFLRRSCYGAALMSVLLGTSASAVAADNADVQVWVIRATTSNSDISPELKSLADSLKKQFKFTGYKLVKKNSKSVAIAGDWPVDLVSPFKATVTVTKKTSDKITLKIVVNEGSKEKQSTTISLPAGQFSLQGGWDLSGGDKLIIAVSGK